MGKPFRLSDQYSGFPSLLNIPNFPRFLRLPRSFPVHDKVCRLFVLPLLFFLRKLCFRAEKTIALRKQETRETISLRKQWALRTHSVIHGNFPSAIVPSLCRRFRGNHGLFDSSWPYLHCNKNIIFSTARPNILWLKQESIFVNIL